MKTKYSTKIDAPIYEPKGIKPNSNSLCDKWKTEALIHEIELSPISEDDKSFLIEAAHRHTVFNYSKIADYYANSNPTVQDLMEKSGLVIIDFQDAIKYGYVKVCEEIRKQYEQEYIEQ